MTEAKLTLNALGWICPKPIIESKRLLDTIAAGQIIVLVDNEIARDNLLEFARSQGYQGHCQEEEGVFSVIINKTADSPANLVPAANQGLLIIITTDTLGSGVEELGQALMKTYLFALSEAEQLPQNLIFMNSGVFLVCEDSPVLQTLQALASAGVDISSCGACLDFYGLTNALAIGKVSNMYEIVNKMNVAGNTIKI